MKTHNDLPQGSAAWHEHRRGHLNASDAPAMLGCSPHKTRDQLLREYSTGIAPEVDAGTQRRFDEGHRAEALARPLAEEIIGEDLYPVVGSDGDLSASFDGLTMDESTGFEHKSLNDELRARMYDGCTGADLPAPYQVQMEQQCMISGAQRILFMASKWNGDALVEERHCWYTPNPALAARIGAGWDQFADDLANYKPEPSTLAPIASVIDALPALVVSVEGRVVSSNLAPFRAAADAFLAKIKTDLQTDQDFADAERTVKFCKDGEERLELVKAQALSQTASIDELFRTVDAIMSNMREKRLQLTKSVTLRKEAIRAEICAKAQHELDAHVVALNSRLGASWLPRMQGYFADAIKGKKTVTSLKEAAASALANAKIDASAQADRLEANRKSLKTEERDWMFLFADFAHVGITDPAETFSAIAAQRIQKHREAEQAEAEAKARAEQIRAEAEAAAAAAAAVAVAAAPAPSPVAPLSFQRVEPRAEAPKSGRPPISTGTLCDRLGFTVTSGFLQQTLGLYPAPAPDRKAGVWWHEADFPVICSALMQHINRVARSATEKAAA